MLVGRRSGVIARGSSGLYRGGDARRLERKFIEVLDSDWVGLLREDCLDDGKSCATCHAN